MEKKMKKLYISIIVILLSVQVYGQSKVGTTAAPFLNIGIGPRAISQGGAVTATVNDVTSLYWNPAGASRSQFNSAMFARTEWFADITYNWAGAMVNIGDLGTIGLSLTYLDYGDMEVTTLEESEGTGEMFSAYDMAMGLTYAYNLTDRFSIGGTVKYVNQSIWNSSASAVAMDLGVLFNSDFYGLKIGAVIMNFGTDMKMDGKDLLVLYDIDDNIYGNNDQILAKLNVDQFPLPLTFKVGIGMDVISTQMNKLTIGVDAIHPSDNNEHLNVGAEYVFMDLISFRGGYKSLFLDNSEEGLSLGVGIKYYFAPDFGIFFDYAYQDFGLLDNTQHFALGINF
jgi:hypothetical protein